MFLFNGTIYDANFHLQQDAATCDPVRCTPGGLAVWKSTGPIVVAGSGAAQPTPSGAAASPSNVNAPRPPDEDETPEEKANRLREERKDHMIYLGALLGGLVVGLWLEGK